jgi:hypothetical protein
MKKVELLLILFSMSSLVGCVSGGNAGGGSTVSVSLTPNSNPVLVGVTLTQRFTANVSGASSQSVTWSISGSGCSGASCGTIDANGLYTAPAAPPNPATVTVKAISAADPSKSGSVTVKIVHISVTVLPTATTVALTGTQQFTPQVTPRTNVTWSVTGTGCSGSACGTVDNNGLYTAPSSMPSPPSVKVIATSIVDPAGTGSANVALVTTFNNHFSGTYAFRFSGFDNNGAVYSAGNFQADGNGNISGVQDVNRNTGVQNLTFTGTYLVGSDNRGTMTLTTTLGTSTYGFAIGANGETIFVEFDNTGTRGAGVIDKAKTPFSAAQVSGPYVINLFGSDLAGKRLGLAGLFQANANILSGGAADLNDNGTASSSSAVSGSYTVNANGRGTMQFVAPGVGTFNFAFYIVDKTEIFFVSTDPVGSDRLGGLALAQDTTLALGNASLKGSAVFNLTGLEESSLSNVVAVGLLNTDGAGALVSGGMFDENNAGTIISQQPLSGTYNIASNGRGTISLAGSPLGAGSQQATSFVAYVATQNRAVLLDVTSQAALSGFLEPQIGANLDATTIQGVFVTGTTATANTGATNITGVLTMNGSNALTGSQDESTPLANTPGEIVAGTYTVASNGRGTMSLTSPTTANRVFYIVNNSKFEAIGVDSGDLKSTVIASQR